MVHIWTPPRGREASVICTYPMTAPLASRVMAAATRLQVMVTDQQTQGAAAV